MSSTYTKTALAALALTATTALTALPANAGPAAALPTIETGATLHRVQLLDRDAPPLFEGLFGIEDERDRRNAISPTRAGDIARRHTPMRVIEIDRQRAHYFVRGQSRSRGLVEVQVNAFSGDVVGVEDLDGRDAGRAISSERAGRIAQRHIDMRITDIDRDRGLYRVTGINNARGEVVVEVDAHNGNIVRSFATNSRVIDRSEAIEIARNNTRIRVADARLHGDVWHVNGRRGGLVKVDARTGNVIQTVNPRSRHGFDNRLISSAEAARAANDYSALDVKRVERTGDLYTVFGVARGSRHVAIEVDAVTGKALRLYRVDNAYSATPAASAAAATNTRTNLSVADGDLIGIEAAKQIARREGIVSFGEISLNNGVYDVRGVTRNREWTVVRVDADTGRVL
ncbi:MAG: PepSY domain-containing protein [Minwuia sp.]|uniref:PepSY domain-containing protein n=1 Tax=Minwuia sp. TaxID=2493630 RepID=UPI003A83EEFD